MTSLLVWPGALAIGLSLGLLGSGGSILTVPVLVYLVGQDEKVAIGGSLAIVAVIALAGSLRYMHQRAIDWRSVLWFGVPGMAGTYGGAWLAAFVSGALQLTVFALVMLTAARLMLSPVDLSRGHERPAPFVVLDGLAVGLLTGFVGVGGGFLIVPALVLLGGIAMQRAVATSLVIVAMKSVVGFAKYVSVLNAAGLHIDLKVIALISAIGVVGSLLGSHVASRLPAAALRRTFGWFLVVIGSGIFINSVQKLMGGG